VLRIAGPLASHANSVVLPFLLPDTPVVAWWPGAAPAVPAQDPVGQLANRRLTDATDTEDPLASIKGRLQGYSPGDTDLSWSRITQWRALLTSALDQAPHEPVNSVLVSGLKTEPQTGSIATLSRTGRPAALVPLPRRETCECLAEDMRRLDADEIYEEALRGIDKVQYV
jgi:glucose-6-phosphate dehydrogenase assembly protein OpcA